MGNANAIFIEPIEWNASASIGLDLRLDVQAKNYVVPNSFGVLVIETCGSRVLDSLEDKLEASK